MVRYFRYDKSTSNRYNSGLIEQIRRTTLKYMGSKNRIAKHILPIMLAEATHKAVEKLFKV